MKTNSERSTAPFAHVLLGILFLAACIVAPSAFGQYSRPSRQGYIKDVPYVYNGKQFVIRLYGGAVNQVLQDGKMVLMLSGGNVVPFPGLDAHLVADAEDALKAYQAGTPSGSSGSAAPTTAAKGALTVDGVITMLEGGLSDDIIIEKIHKSGQTFDLSADDLVRLKKAKASDAVLKAMMESSPSSASPPAGIGPSTATSVAQPQAQQAAATTSQPTAPSTQSADAPKKKPGFWGSVGQGVKDSVQGKTVIDSVGLRNVLPEWDPHKPLSEQFPHVAITVLYAPMGWTEPYATDPNVGKTNLIPICFKLEAVVWSDATNSKKVGPFNWCSDHDEMMSQLEPTYLYSLNPSPMDMRSGYFTGINRTDGPAPPDKPLPNDRATMDMEAKTNPQGRSMDLNLDSRSRFAIMFANVRRDLGQTLTADGDYRVWIVSIKKASGPSILH